MRRLAIILAALLASSPAWAAPQWNVATVTGAGGQTGAYTTIAICDSSHWLEIERRATTLTGKVTLNTVTAPGAVTRENLTVSSPTNFSKLLGVGCDASTIVLAGSGRWISFASLSNPSSWSSAVDNSSSGNGYGGFIFPSPAGGGKWRFHQAFGGDNSVYISDYVLSPFAATNLANSTPNADELELVSVAVSSSLDISAGVSNGSGQSYFRPYVSGSSYAATAQESSASATTGSYYYQPFSMNGTLGAFTIKRQSNNQIYIRWVNSSGTITNLNTGSTTDLRPLGDWDPSGSLRRGWWLGTDGTARKSNSISAPTSISTDSAYDVGTTAMQGSTVVTGFTTQYNGSTVGVDMNQDGTSGDAVVLLASKAIAYYGEPPVVATASPKPRPASGGVQAIQVLRRLIP